jgi:hypothetical protein
MGDALYSVINQNQDNWAVQLGLVLSSYRTSVHPATGETPYFLLYGRDPVLPDRLIFQDLPPLSETVFPFVKSIVQHMQTIHAEVHKRQAARAIRAKEYYDAKFNKKKENFDIGSKVYIYFETSWDRDGSRKFASRWSGPYRILEQINDLDYKCRHTLTNHELTVHVDRMRLMKETDKPRAWKRDIINPAPTPLTTEYEVEAIKDRQWNSVKKQWEWLIHWTGYQEETWEPIENLEGANLLWYNYQDKHPYPPNASHKPVLRTARRQL